MNEIVGWIVGNTQSGPHSFRKKKPHGWQYSDGLVAQSYHEAEVARLRAELSNAHAAIESKAGWEWKKEADRLRAEVEAYRKDAQRYRWLRDFALHHEEADKGTPYIVYGLGMGDVNPCLPAEIDAMVDHSMSQDVRWKAHNDSQGVGQ